LFGFFSEFAHDKVNIAAALSQSCVIT